MLYTMESMVSKDFTLHVAGAKGKMLHSFSPVFCHAKAHRRAHSSRCNAT
jgi:hypothetical protein